MTVTVSGGALTADRRRSRSRRAQVQAIPLPWVAALKGPTFDQNTVVGDPGPSRIVPAVPTTSRRTARERLPVQRARVRDRRGHADADGGRARARATAAPGRTATRTRTTPRCSCRRTSLTRRLRHRSRGRRSARRPGFLAVVATADNTHVTVNPVGAGAGRARRGPSMMVRGDSYTYTLPTQGDVLEMFSDTGDIHNAGLHAGPLGLDPPGRPAGRHLRRSRLHLHPREQEGVRPPRVVDVPGPVAGHRVHRDDAAHAARRARVGAHHGASTTTRRSCSTRPSSGTNGALLNAGDVIDLPDVDASPSPSPPTGASSSPTTSSASSARWPADAGVPTPDLGDPERVPRHPHLRSTARRTRSSRRSSYSENWIDVIAPTGRDGRRSTAPTIPAGDFTPGRQPALRHRPRAARHGKEGHSITGTLPFGLYVYGYGSRTSYMYPGGLDLRVQVVPPPPAQ